MLYNRGSRGWGGVGGRLEREGRDIYIFVAYLHCHTVEINTTL